MDCTLFNEPQDKNKFSVLVFPLRQEAQVSGEKQSYDFISNFIKKMGFQVLTLKAASKVTSTFYSFFEFDRFLSLIKISKNNLVNSIILKIPTASQIFIIGLLTLGFKGKIIVWIDGISWKTPNFKILIKLIRFEPIITVIRFIINHPYWIIFARFFNFEIVVSSQVQKHQIERFLGKSHLITVITNNFNNNYINKELKNITRFGYLGHAYPIKGISNVIESFCKLKLLNLNFNGVFAFSGRGDKHFEIQAKEKGFEVLGKVNPIEYLMSIDCLVAPFWAEWGTNTFPSVLIEAIKTNTLIITTDFELHRELFMDYNRVIFIPPNNSDTLTQTLFELVTNQKNRINTNNLYPEFKKSYDSINIETKWKLLFKNLNNC